MVLGVSELMDYVGWPGAGRFAGGHISFAAHVKLPPAEPPRQPINVSMLWPSNESIRVMRMSLAQGGKGREREREGEMEREREESPDTSDRN